MTALSCGVLVPCRDEAGVIERRLANLARLEWPGGARHRLVVVDDGSRDATAELARGALAPLRALGVEAEVLENDVRPGKNGAIEAGLARLAGVDVVVLTDADVVTSAGALVALERALASEPRLGMASGAQTFVRALEPDGRAPGEEGAGLEPCGAGWDRLTAVVRRLESRAGKLFSVHGQWLAWRADLALAPAPGVAADDVDLMLRVRASARPRVALVEGARFFEEKPGGEELGEAQALRRARAWFQVFAEPGRPPLRGLDAVQRAVYAHLPRRLPELQLLLVAAALAAVLLPSPWPWGLVSAVVLGLLALSPPGREWARITRTIRRARRAEARGAMGEAWESLRG